MWEASVYNYNATRRNIIFTVNHSRYIPCMLLTQVKELCSEDNIFHSKSMYVGYGVRDAGRPIRARLWRT